MDERMIIAQEKLADAAISISTSLKVIADAAHKQAIIQKKLEPMLDKGIELFDKFAPLYGKALEVLGAELEVELEAMSEAERLETELMTAAAGEDLTAISEG